MSNTGECQSLAGQIFVHASPAIRLHHRADWWSSVSGQLYSETKEVTRQISGRDVATLRSPTASIIAAALAA
jgi:hypothetical protein